jgi:hypothetical protein
MQLEKLLIQWNIISSLLKLENKIFVYGKHFNGVLNSYELLLGQSRWANKDSFKSRRK